MAAVEGQGSGRPLRCVREGWESRYREELCALLHEPQDGCPVEVAVAVTEDRAGEDVALGLADGGGVDEAGGLVRRKAEKDLLQDLRRKAEEVILYRLTHQR